MTTATRTATPPRLRGRLIRYGPGGPAHSRRPNELPIMRGYALRPDPNLPIWEQRTAVSLARAIAALQRCPNARCLTHTSAALVHGLGMWSKEPDVYLATSSRPRRAIKPLPAVRYSRKGPPTAVRDGWNADVQLVRLRSKVLELRDDEIIEVGGLPVTNVLRTAFDCACDEPVHNALSIADTALRMYCEPDVWQPSKCKALLRQAREIWQEMLRASTGRHGIRRARVILAAANPWAESPPESVVRWMTLALGLPDPALQHQVDTRRGVRFLDLSWPELRLALEVDGRLKYQRAEDIYDEKLRQDAIQAQGWTMARIPAEDLRDLRAVAGRVMRLFPPSVLAGRRPAPLLVGAGLWGSRAEGPVPCTAPGWHSSAYH